ncbi:MAG: hypothetical protein QW434_05490 [Pyrobaculum sp.]
MAGNYLLVKLVFHSPYYSYPAGAEGGRGPTLPPPSTLIGALMAAYLRLRKPTEDEPPPHLVSSIKYAYFRAPPYATTASLNTHFTWLAQRKQRLELIRAMGILNKTVIGAATEEELREAAKIIINYARGPKELGPAHLRSDPYSWMARLRAMLFSPWPTYETYFWGDAYVLYLIDSELEDIKQAANHIFRVGPKETLVSSSVVEVKSVKIVDGSVGTRFYVPRDATTSACRRIEHMLTTLGDPIELMYMTKQTQVFCLPAPYTEELEFYDPAPGWVGVELETDNGTFQVIVPVRYAPS